MNIRYSVGVNSAPVGVITATPIVRGSIIDAYLYEKGTNYGSSILNLHKTPKLIVKNGKDAQLKPIISNGRIVDVNIQYGGAEYYSIPDITIKGSGTGALIKPIIANNKIVDVVIEIGRAHV